MTFEKFFRLISYTAVFCGFLSLWVSGTFGVVGTCLFVGVMAAAWFLEGSRWQITERIGTALIVLSLPAFYLIYQFQLIPLYGSETVIAGILSRMILSLTAIKLLQKKSDRDWIFLYLMAFFEVLLAAGLSISLLYLLSFVLFVMIMVCTIIAFEVKRTAERVAKSAGPPVQIESRAGLPGVGTKYLRRLSFSAALMVSLIIAAAIPLFFVLPRVGGAGFGGNQSGLSTYSGFSSTVRLGGIGRIQQNDEVVMRVRSDSRGEGYYRGVALDTFDNVSWSKSRAGVKEQVRRLDDDTLRFEPVSSYDGYRKETIYLEPLDTPVIFARPRLVAIENGPVIASRDQFGAVEFPRSFERTTYTAISDTQLPPPDELRADPTQYGSEMQNYLQVPAGQDRRIFDLAYAVSSSAKNRYDKAAAVERYLQTKYAYTLEQAAAGDEPLSDFLFNVRRGHCEYFATAMVMMLRTQGIAARLVNGFHGGDHNDMTGITVIRQRHAHSWVEVYFPTTKVWVTFDPTPFSDSTEIGRFDGFGGTISKYLDAIQAVWIEYFVAFDGQGQRSATRTFRGAITGYQETISSYAMHSSAVLKEWWSEVRGDKGLAASLAAIGWLAAYVSGLVVGIALLAWICRKIVKWKVWRRLADRIYRRRGQKIVEFYDRMQRMLKVRGFIRRPDQTPLEFAFATGIPEAMSITQRYNSVRFGEKTLSDEEADEIEMWLTAIFRADRLRPEEK